MVCRCCVNGCNEYYGKTPGISFHRFPRDMERRKLWASVLSQDFIPTDKCTVCSKHFTEDCYDKEKFGGTWLKQSAIPSIFDFTVDSQEVAEQRKRKPQVQKSVQLQEPTVKKQRLCYVGDFKEGIQYSPLYVKKRLFLAQKKICEQRIKIKKLQRKKHGLQERIKSLSALIKEFNEESLTYGSAQFSFKFSKRSRMKQKDKKTAVGSENDEIT